MRKIRQLLSRFLFPFGTTISILKVGQNSFAEVKKTALRLKANNDLHSYNRFINKLSGKKFKRIKFIGHGGALSTTQTHAIVNHKNNNYFEKIFDLQSRDYQFLKRHYHFYQELLADKGVNIPALINVYEAENIAVCHFEFITKLEPLESKWTVEGLKALAIFKSIPYAKLEYGKDYTELILFHKALISILQAILNDKDTLLKFIEIKKFIEKQNMVFTHGDFYVLNVFRDQIIDWDDMGFYPYGIDMAFLLHNAKDVDTSNIDNVYIYIENLNMTKEEQVGTIYFLILINQIFSKITYHDQIKWINRIHDKIESMG